MMVFYCCGYGVGIDDVVVQVGVGINVGNYDVWMWVYQCVYVEIDIVGWGVYLDGDVVIFKGKCMQG